MSWKILMKQDDEIEEYDDEIDALVMWYRIGHLLISLGTIFLIGSFAVLIIALFVHAFVLPGYTVRLVIALDVLGVVSIFGGKMTVNSVYKNDKWKK